MRPGRCSNRAVSTLRGGDDAITGKRAAFFIRELQAQRKREDSSVQQRKRERCGRSRIRATQQHSSRDSSQSGTEEHPPAFSHKTAPVKQKRARRSCRYSLYRFCAVYDRFWLPQDQLHSPREKHTFSRMILKYSANGVTWCMLLSSALVRMGQLQRIMITS